jgi:lipid-A-disaccharide synthase
MKYYVIAGEASGDLHGANLIKALKQIDRSSEFRCWGGDLMKAEGAEIIKDYKDLAFMGFVEVIANLKTILNNIKFCKEDILSWKPDLLILIDYPGFNLRIAEFAKANSLKVVYYISPQIWAWKQSRVHKIKRTVDKMLVILPFEKEFYNRFSYSVEFVGHPLLDAISNFSETSMDWRREQGLDKRKIIALLPGSRKQEINTMLPIMLDVRNDFKDYQFVIAGAPGQNPAVYSQFTENKDVKIVFGSTYSLLKNSHAALVTSGTATLETALFNVPQVVCYKGNFASYLIARQLIKIKYISLVNLIMDAEVVKELIQDEFNKSNLTQELKLIIEGEGRLKMLESFQILKEKLGGEGASKKAATSIFEMFS